MNEYSISVFFPAYNDEDTIGDMILTAKHILEKLTDDYEIIVVDDNSPDNSGKIADGFAQKFKEVKVIHHKFNKGYGGALRSGFANAKKELIFYTDGDGQYDVKELEKLIPLIEDADVVTGYKIKRSDALYRIIAGRLYHWIVRILFNLKLKDIDCDFRLFRRHVFDKIKLESNSGIICVEMMKKIQKAGFKIKEAPVHHYPRVSGTSQFFNVKRIFRVFVGLAKQWFKLMV